MNTRRVAMRIGDVARETGVSADALRYYERLGLIQPPARSDGGLRRYGPDVIERIDFIKTTQRLGLTLREVRELVGTTEHRGRGACERVRTVLVNHVAAVDRQLADLRALRRTLTAYLTACEKSLAQRGDPDCPTLDALTQRPTTKAAR